MTISPKSDSSQARRKSGTRGVKKGRSLVPDAAGNRRSVHLPGMSRLKEQLAIAKRVVAYVEASQKLETPYAEELHALELELYGRRLTDRERREKEASVLMNTARITKELMEASHPTPWVREYLGGISRQAVNSKVVENKLLAFKENGQLYFPGWQFDPEAPGKVIAGLPDVLSALSMTNFSKVRWFTRPQASFKGKTPLEMLREGRIDQVVTEARTTGVF